MDPMTQTQDSHGTTVLYKAKEPVEGRGAEAAKSKIFILNVNKYLKIIFKISYYININSGVYFTLIHGKKAYFFSFKKVQCHFFINSENK
jgi:hypothetical protein